MIKKIFILVLFVSVVTAQQNDPYRILDSVKSKFMRIQDYEVDVTITVDVNFLKVPETHAKIYFKQPDKVRFMSEGFALLPKEGLNFSPTKLLNQDYTAIYTGQDTLDNNNVAILKVIPSDPESEIILTSLWIDEIDYNVRKIETTTKTTGTLQIRLKYNNKTEFSLPSKVIFSFNIADIKIPTSISGEFDKEEESAQKKKNKPMVGTVTIDYENYKINKGIPDSIFEEQEKN